VPALKIVHVSTEDTTGGAARAAYRLHTGLRRHGHESSMFVAVRHGEDPDVVAFKPPMDFFSRLNRRLRRELIGREFARYRLSRPSGCDYFSDDRSIHGTGLLGQLPVCDVINLHFIARFVDHQTFIQGVPRRIPIVWRLADMNSLTGGCHVSEGCLRYRDGCGACPQLGSNDPKDLSNRIWNRKQRLFSRLNSDRLHIVALSQWMACKVREESLLRKFPLTIIPNGIDTGVFAPRDRQFSRNVLGLPENAKILLFVAQMVTNRTKGLDLLVRALAELNDLSNLHLVSVGKGKPIHKLGIPHLHLGEVRNERLLSLIYSAADIFVIPSREDNFPNTVIESLACGTPVVGFEVGGIPDMVRPGITGLLVPPEDTVAMSNSITHLLQNSTMRREMARDCRRIAMDEYSQDVQVKRYIKLYEEILTQNSR
jgi:glycosyltransferase involved in cell wall biosynthesis